MLVKIVLEWWCTQILKALIPHKKTWFLGRLFFNFVLFLAFFFILHLSFKYQSGVLVYIWTLEQARHTVCKPFLMGRWTKYKYRKICSELEIDTSTIPRDAWCSKNEKKIWFTNLFENFFWKLWVLTLVLGIWFEIFTYLLSNFCTLICGV